MMARDETLIYGTGEWASLAARSRTSGRYHTASLIEASFGESRRWDAQGQTMFAVFKPTYALVQDRKCFDRELIRDFTPPLPFTAYQNKGGA